jgi:predicted small secreted protein
MSSLPTSSSSIVSRAHIGPLVLACALLGGCEAMLGTPNESAPEQTSDSSDENANSPPSNLPDLDSVDCDVVPTDPGDAPLRLLSRSEFLNTLEVFFGPLQGVAEALPHYIPPSSLGVAQAPMSASEVEALSRAAEIIAAQVVADPERLASIAPCPVDAVALDCARAFVNTFVAQAYRAPLLDEGDVAAHLALFEAGAEENYARGIELLVRGIVQAPRFLYQVEIGTSRAVSEKAVELSSHEISARLSYAVWQSPPDELLRAAAASGDLGTEEGLQTQLSRMLEDPRGQAFASRFLAALIHLERVAQISKDASRYPEWETLRQPIERQAWAFFDHVLHEEGGTLDALLTSNSVLVNEALAPHYGVTAGPEFSAISAAESTVSGILTLPALMAVLAKADQSSPIHRGVFVREALLCQSPPAPPPDIPAPPSVDSGASTRERLAQHVSEPACAGCHSLIDPIGLGFEHYDAIGFYRSTDAGDIVDASGELLGTDVNGPFNGAYELGEKLRKSAAVEQCFSQQWFRYVAHRKETADDLCSLKAIVSEFRGSGRDIKSLARAIIRTPAFRYRRPSDAEIQP